MGSGLLTSDIKRAGTLTKFEAGIVKWNDKSYHSFICQEVFICIMFLLFLIVCHNDNDDDNDDDGDDDDNDDDGGDDDDDDDDG